MVAGGVRLPTGGRRAPTRNVPGGRPPGGSSPTPVVRLPCGARRTGCSRHDLARRLLSAMRQDTLQSHAAYFGASTPRQWAASSRIEKSGCQYRELAERRDRPRGLAAFAVARRPAYPVAEFEFAGRRQRRPGVPASIESLAEEGTDATYAEGDDPEESPGDRRGFAEGGPVLRAHDAYRRGPS